MAGPAVPPTIRDLRTGDVPVCERILRDLPEWFGIEETLRRYVAELSELETLVAEAEEEVVGFLALRPHGPASAEIEVMAVDRRRHRAGIGRSLVREAENRLRARGCEFLQVKTLGPSRPSDSYARTRRFYENVGFVWLEETDLWGPVNPCLILVRHLGCDSALTPECECD